MGLSRTVSETTAISVENRKIFPPRVFCAPAEGVPLGIGYRRWKSKNRNDGTTGPRKNFDDIFSCLDTMCQRDRRTDRQTDGHRATAKTALTNSDAQ